MKILFVLFFLFPMGAMSYVPRTQTIVKKMSNNNGRKDYKIVREVTIESGSKQIKAREEWTVANGDKMRVNVSSQDPSNPWKFAIIYDKNSRKTLSQGKKEKTFKKSSDFFESIFHDRYHKSLMTRLVHFRFLPEWVKQAPAPQYDEGKTKMTPEPFVSLAPMEGSVNYALGATNNTDGGRSQTQLWVEQDSFLIKKGRLRSSAEFTNSNFQSFVGGLKLPGEQQINWDDKVAKIKLLKAERTKTNKKTWSLQETDFAEIPSDPLVKEFYSRFR